MAQPSGWRTRTTFNLSIRWRMYFAIFNRNNLLFTRKIGDGYAMLSRPSDTEHTPFGDIFYRESPDLIFWGKHRNVISTIGGEESAWQSQKNGSGPIPIETDEGWLLIDHEVINTCNGFVYRIVCALGIY